MKKNVLNFSENNGTIQKVLNSPKMFLPQNVISYFSFWFGADI